MGSAHAASTYPPAPMASLLARVRGERGRHLAPGTGLGPRFNIFWFGQAVSQFGDYLSYLALPLFVASISDLSMSLAIVYSLDTVPTMLFGLLGGLLLDRLRLRYVMIASDLARAASFVILARIAWVAENGGQVGLLSIFWIAFAIGVFGAGFVNAMFTIVPFLVRRARLTTANGRVAATQNIAFAAGPAAAGVLIDAFGFWVTFLLNSLTFLVSASCLLVIGQVRRVAEPASRSSVLRETLHGLRYVWRELRLRVSTIAAAVANFVVGFLESTYVLLAADVGAESGTDTGLIFAAFGVGAIVGAVTASPTTKLLGLGRTMTVGLAVFGAGMFAFVNTEYSLVALLLPLAAHVGLQWVNVPLATIRQAYSPNVILGRVITATRAIGWATLPIGSLIGAAVADRAGFSNVVKVAPLIILFTAVALVPTILWRDTFKAPEAEPQESRL